MSALIGVTKCILGERVRRAHVVGLTTVTCQRNIGANGLQQNEPIHNPIGDVMLPSLALISVTSLLYPFAPSVAS